MSLNFLEPESPLPMTGTSLKLQLPYLLPVNWHIIKLQAPFLLPVVWLHGIKLPSVWNNTKLQMSHGI